MSTTTQRKPQTITTPEFCVVYPIRVVVPEQQITLEGGGGSYEVFLQISPALRRNIGRISKDGTGWTAFVRAAGQDDTNWMPSFVGDHFPVRTGKHTRTYAICFLVAVAAGFTSTRATYDLRYEGVSA